MNRFRILLLRLTFHSFCHTCKTPTCTSLSDVYILTIFLLHLDHVIAEKCTE